MRWFTIVVVALLLTGCNGSDDTTRTTASTPVETTGESDRPPRTYNELLARLPPLDEPATPDVNAYRRATIGALFEHCLARTGGAARPPFLRANRTVFDLAPPPRGARFVAQSVIEQRDGNGCLEGAGPPTYYTTERTYRLRHGMTAEVVFAHFERVMRGWLETSGTTPCDRRFSQGPAYLAVYACNGVLRLTALGRAPRETPLTAHLPPRPFGAQYPVASNYLRIPEPTSDELRSGQTCERVLGMDVPSIIVPPPPGVRAEIERGQVHIEWSFDHIQGDCPPTQVVLSLVSPGREMPPYTVRTSVHAHSGTAEIPVLETFRDAQVLRAAAESFDGARSRSVAVLIRRPE
jgi:hypothetical protein